MPPIVRTLPPEEYDRLAQFPGPLGTVAKTAALDPEQTRLIIIEDPGTPGPDGRPTILGYWTLFNAVHAEPLYLDPAIRQHPKLGKALLTAVLETLQAEQIQSVFAIIEHAQLAVMGPMAERLGLRPLPGILYGGSVPQASSAGNEAEGVEP